MHSENHYLDEIFLRDLMFDDFKAKSWSDAKDKEDLDRAKESAEIENANTAFDAAIDFANLWMDAYYADMSFDYGLLTHEIEEWGDDGPDSRYFEIQFKRDGKSYQTVYLNFFKRVDGEWGIIEAVAKGE